MKPTKLTSLKKDFKCVFVSVCAQHCSENGGISPLDDGLPDFYTKRVLPDR